MNNEENVEKNRQTASKHLYTTMDVVDWADKPRQRDSRK